jgi:TonB family protein
MSEKTLFDGALLKRENAFSRIRTALAAVLQPTDSDGVVPEDAPVHFEQIREVGVARRLIDQLGFAVKELGRDPVGFVAVMFSPDLADPDQAQAQRAAWALAAIVPVFLLCAFGFGLFLANLMGFVELQPTETASGVEITELGPIPDLPMAKKAERSGGGGGGGNKAPTPPSKGKLPTARLQDPILAPTTRPTPLPPSLPVMPTIKADPTIVPPNPDPNSLGDPRGIEGPPSDGPGEGHGIGTGKGGGVGSGDGIGAGPGSGWNIGGGDPRLGGGTGDQNDKTAVSKAVILNSPRPSYTEQARINKTQGTVTVRALLGANGSVKSASVVRGLPDGLNEMALQAVYRLQFRPARNGAGQPVDQWMSVQITFTLR